VTCQVCQGRAELFLCTQHTGELRANLTRLAQGPYIPATKGRTASGGNWHIERRTPGLLDNLADVVLKRTKLGSGGGHRKRGDEMPALYEPDTAKGKQTAQGRADHLLAAACNSLSTIIRDLCESRGGQPKLDDPDPVQMATWLAEHAHTIACDESAGQWWAEIDSLVRRIERAIDRPVRFELLGVCFTQLGEGKTCDTALRAPEGAIEVRCPKCRTVRRCDIVRRNAQSDARRELITWQQVLDTNRLQAEGWRVHERTLRDWRSTGVLKPQQYRRADGTQGINRHSDADEPLYKWDDVERVRSKPRSERKRTRAGR
jgi:LSD1 subclass zinc finger protein